MARILRKLRGAGLFICFVLLASLIAAKLELNGQVSIAGPFVAIDGDTLAAGAERLRLEGMDAPEFRQLCKTDRGADWACGEEARVALERLVSGTAVECRAGERDRYERLLVRCRDGERDINAEMVRIGMAVASGDYHGEEASAREARAGLWTGTFETPRDWRVMHGMMDDPAMTKGFMAWLRGWFTSN